MRVALVEFRDHRPEDYSFTARSHDFTEDVKSVRRWLQQAVARGGVSSSVFCYANGFNFQIHVNDLG